MKHLSIIQILLLFTVSLCCHAEILQSPQPVNTITPSQSDYLSPENTLEASFSALYACDLEWADIAIDKESLEIHIQGYKKANIERKKICDLQKTVEYSQIIEKVHYKDAVILIVEAYGYDGSFQQLPFTFIKEDGLWKFTNKYTWDEAVLDRMYYVPPLFDGKGQKPTDTNLFLGYEQPTQASTELQPGETQYKLHIYYGKTIYPTTFTATLNKLDISTLFTPSPFSDEEVLLQLSPGRNVLVLSVIGETKTGMRQKDSDRLVFIVP
jgi:hypothetical protein